MAALMTTGCMSGCGSPEQKRMRQPTPQKIQQQMLILTARQKNSRPVKVFRVGFVNIDNGDTNCYPAMMNFKAYVESAEFAKAVGA